MEEVVWKVKIPMEYDRVAKIYMRDQGINLHEFIKRSVRAYIKDQIILDAKQSEELKENAKSIKEDKVIDYLEKIWITNKYEQEKLRKLVDKSIRETEDIFNLVLE